jgi:hypothetical protein
MDEQLVAVQTMAENIEQDFPASQVLNLHWEKVAFLFSGGFVCVRACGDGCN